MFHRPLRRPLAIVALLSLVDYLLWNWSLGGNHGIVALIAGLTLVPLLIALCWLLAVGATRLLSDVARSAHARSAANSANAGLRAGRRPSRRTAAGATARAGRATAAARPARGRRAVAGADAGEASSQTSPSSKLAA